jgi:agmatine/peptidylarginine deiminase
MTQQPEALRLADRLDLYATGDAHQQDIEQAAAELRRLHDLCAEWERKAATWLASPEAAKRLDGYRELAQPEQEPVVWVLPKMHPVMEFRRAHRGFRVR